MLGRSPSCSTKRRSQSQTEGSLATQVAVTEPPATAGTEDDFGLDDADNPLLMLARASDLPVSAATNPSALGPSLSSLPVQNVPPKPEHASQDVQLRTFFGPFCPSLDVGQDIDPIDMGLVALSEVDVLFNLCVIHLFHQLLL